jgi:hypothetical protein
MEWRVPVGSEVTTALFEPAPAPASRIVFVCGHGAGGHRSDRGLRATATELLARGLSLVTFNFLYREKGSRRPDPMPRLLECFSAVVSRLRDEVQPGRLVIGGRSMGGRVASLLAAEGLACDGLLLLAYPLHPAGQPEKLRSAHLASIGVPVLCLNGTRDSLCRRDLMEGVVSGLGEGWTQHWLAGADHGFHVLKSSGRTDQDVMAEIGAAATKWMEACFG